MPSPTDSAWKTGKKVILSFRQEEKVRVVAEKLRNYVIYLTHHAVTNQTQELDHPRSVVIQNDEQFRMLQWLSNDDPSIGHNRAIQKKQHHSGQWFLESADFEDWRSSTRSFAWLHGIRRWHDHPLQASRVLIASSWLWKDNSMVRIFPFFTFSPHLANLLFNASSTIIAALQEVLEAQMSSTIAYWYFDFDKGSSLNVNNMLRSLIKQLCVGEAIIPIPVQEMCAKYRASGHQPTTTVLLATLHSAIDSIRKKTFLILDALDEYPESRRPELLATLKLLKDAEHGDVHVLVTSRREFDIEHALHTIATHEVSVHGPVVDSDIALHIRATLAEDARFSRLPPSIKDTIEIQLVTKAHGMSVSCQYIIG